MSTHLFLWLFIGLGLVSLLIGLYAAQHIRTQHDYFLAGRRIGTMPLALTLAATHIGGGLILGTSDLSYHYGLFGILYTIGIFLSFLLLASGFASKLRSFHVDTTAQIFETVYGSVWLRKIASILIIISMCGILVGQVIAARKFIYGLGIENELVFLAFWAFVIVYTMVGGLKAVILTDIYQVIFILLLFTVIFFFTLYSYPIADMEWQPKEAFSDIPIGIIGPLLLPVMFCIVEQDLAQRCFAAKTRRIATWGALIAAAIVLFFGFIPTYFGVLTAHLGLEVAQDASALVVLMTHLTSDFVLALIVIALLAAIISTSDSLLCAISSNLAQDFHVRQLQGKHAVNFSRLITLICGIITLIVAYQFDNIIAVLLASYELPVSALFVSIFFACLCKRVYYQAALLSVLAGAGAFFLFRMIEAPFSRELIQIACSFLGYGVGTVLAKRRAD